MTFPRDSERVLCGTCGKTLVASHYCDPGDRERLERSRDPQQRADYRRGIVAMMLARDLETYEALLRGEKVHPSRIDQEARARLRASGVDV